MNALTPVYVRTQNFIIDRAETYKRQMQEQERGAGIVEYAGLIVLAAAILAALYASGVISQLGKATTTAIDKIFPGS